MRPRSIELGATMRKTALIASAALTGAVVLPGMIVSSSSALSAGECLAGPNSPSPPGSHWYYRLERPSQRKCWYLGPEGREVHATSAKVRVAAKKSVAPVTTATAKVKTNAASQTVPADKPSASVETQSANSSVSKEGSSSPLTSAADEQALSSSQIELPPMPPAPVSSDPEPAASVAQKSVSAAAGSVENDDVPNTPVVQPNSMIDTAQADSGFDVSAQVRDPDRKDIAKSATFIPMRALVLIPAALAFSGLFAFAVFPSGLRRQIYARRWGAKAETTAQEEIPATFHDAMVEPDPSDPQIEIPEELKRNLEQVLQTLKAQVHGESA